MKILNRILIKASRIGLINKIFGTDVLEKRQIRTGPLKGMFFYGKYYDNWYFGGSFENKIIKTIGKVAESGNIYDIGSHFGFYSLIFARLIKNGKVYCFDPNPQCFERLEKTIELNNLKDKVKVFCFGIGSENTEKEMMILPGNLARSTLDEELKEYYDKEKKYEFQKEKILLKSLDDLNLPPPNLIKIDVEGFEFDVIKGMIKVLNNYHPNLIVEIHEGHRVKGCCDGKEIIKILLSLGYVCLHIEDNKIIDGESVFSGGHILASINKEKIKLVQQSSR